MNSGPVYVLDLGTSKVALLAADRSDDGEVRALDLVLARNRGMQRGTVTDLDETAAAIQQVLTSCRMPEGPLELIVSVNGGHLEGINAQGFQPIFPPHRPIHREDVLHVVNHSRQVMPSPDREQILALPREFRVDGQRGIQRPVGMSGKRLEVVTHLITGAIGQLHNVERVVEMCGWKVAQMVPAPFASALSVVTQAERNNGCVVVDLGAGTSCVTVFAGGGVAGTACIPIGGSHVTYDLSKLLKMTPEEAEQLKLDHGRAIVGQVSEESTVEVRQIGQPAPRHLQRRVLYEIVEARMREVVGKVREQVERTGMFGMLPGGVILTGGGAAMPGVPQLFAKALKDPNVRVASPQLKGPASARIASSEHAVVAGLALYALQDRSDDVEPASGFDSWKERFLTLFQMKV